MKKVNPAIFNGIAKKYMNFIEQPSFQIKLRLQYCVNY